MSISGFAAIRFPAARFPATALAWLLTAGAVFVPQPSGARQPSDAPAQHPIGPGAPAIGSVSTDGVTLTRPLSVGNGRAELGNNSTVTAGTRSAEITLARGGKLVVCATTGVHLSRDAQPLAEASPIAGAKPSAGRTPEAARDTDDAGLMLALDRGAIEADYPAGRYSDVVLTPDLRILISGPGAAEVKLRVNRQGDTCVDNHGDHAPYVTVSSLRDGGIYRVQPNQRVLFELGDLQSVVDHEAEPCGCPAPADPALLAGNHLGGPSSTPADTAFPIAVSEGLAAPPAQPSTPVVPVGQAHAQVTATLSSNTPPDPPPEGAPSEPVGPSGTPATVPTTQPAKPQPAGLLHRIGHFFTHLFN